MEQLTPRQNQTLQAIAGFWRQGRPPTTGELCQVLQLRSEQGLSNLLRPIEQKGFISIQGGVHGRQRHIQLTSKGRVLTYMGLPVLGEIPAGALQEAIQTTDEWIDNLAGFLNVRPDDFALRVKGDSMIGAGILSGDLVVLRPNIEAIDGEVVAAQIYDEVTGSMEATLKHIYRLKTENRVRLCAANPDYPDREFPADRVSTAGVFRGLVREFKK